jgi:hypothetical protein
MDAVGYPDVPPPMPLPPKYNVGCPVMGGGGGGGSACHGLVPVGAPVVPSLDNVGLCVGPFPPDNNDDSGNGGGTDDNNYNVGNRLDSKNTGLCVVGANVGACIGRRTTGKTVGLVNNGTSVVGSRGVGPNVTGFALVSTPDV